MKNEFYFKKKLQFRIFFLIMLEVICKSFIKSSFSSKRIEAPSIAVCSIQKFKKKELFKKFYELNITKFI